MDQGQVTEDRVRRWALRAGLVIAAGLAAVGLAACLPPGAQANVTSVSAGGDHACAVLADSTVTCWGENQSGEVGTGTVDPVPSPTMVAGLTGVVSVSAGRDHTCALDDGGTVWCWGEGDFGRLGTGGTADELTPVSVLTGAASVSAGTTHTCAALEAGEVRCWGTNDMGQLGDGGTVPSSTPVTATGIAGAVGVTSGSRYTCALLSDGTVSCWGRNTNGQLGDGTLTSPRLTPTPVPGLGGVTQIEAGAATTCALLGDGTARCWGANSLGQAGIGNSVPSNLSTPTLVALPPAVQSISVGHDHGCATVGGGEAWCWGSHSQGQVGDGTRGAFLPSTRYRSTPVPVVNPDPNASIVRDAEGGVVPDPAAMFDDATSIAAGTLFTCASKSNKTVQCWGQGSLHQLGDGWGGHCSAPGADYRCWVPVQVGVAAPFTGAALPGGASGTADHSCAIESDNTAVCWGRNASGQLGAGHTGQQTRALSSRLPGVVSVAAGESHTCWALADGTVRCAGEGSAAIDRSALGYQTSADEPLALTVTGGSKTDPPAITTAVQVVAGRQFSCARLAGGTVECWGSNGLGQLGNWQVTESSTDPVPACIALGETCVVPLTDVVELAAGRDHVCALRSDGTVWCWGSANAGQSGPPNSAPQQITGVAGATTIGAGDEHSCAALGVGGVKCWGRNSSGQLGASFPASGSTPVSVSGLVGVVDQLDGGSMHTCAVTEGELWCWGENDQGQLGTGTTTGTVGANDCPPQGAPPLSQGSCVPDPVQVTSVSDAASVVAGRQHTCVRSVAGAYQCWGVNDESQTGSASVGTPVLDPVIPVTPPGG